MANTNPYASPSVTEEPAKIQVRLEYPSRTKAIVAGLWQGAKFGGKWMALILVIISLLVWIPLVAMFLYQWLYTGADFWELATKLKLLQGLGMTLAAILYITVLTAIVGALIMGAAAGISYRKPPNQYEK